MIHYEEQKYSYTIQSKLIIQYRNHVLMSWSMFSEVFSYDEYDILLCVTFRQNLKDLSRDL